MLDFDQTYAVRIVPHDSIWLAGRQADSSCAQVCAAGGLVGFLAKAKARGELRGFDEEGGLRVGGIVTFTPCVLLAHCSACTRAD